MTVGMRLGCGVFVLLSACAIQHPPPPTPDFIAWSKTGTLKKQMCVLPFANQTPQEELAERVRRRFAGHLSVKHFSDRELYEIDATLTRLGSGWRNLSPQELGKALGCDALAYGTLLNSRRLYLLIYSQLALAGEIRVVDVASGRTLVDEVHVSTLHLGGAPLSPFFILYNAFNSLQNFGDAQMTKAVDDLGLQLAEKVPDLSRNQQDRQDRQDPKDPQDPRRAALATPAPPEAPLPGPTTAQPEERYQVQVAAFQSAAEADKAAAKLSAHGFQPVVEPSADVNHTWHRVSVGVYPSAREAYQVRDAIEARFAFSPIVTRKAGR